MRLPHAPSEGGITNMRNVAHPCASNMEAPVLQSHAQQDYSQQNIDISIGFLVSNGLAGHAVDVIS